MKRGVLGLSFLLGAAPLSAQAPAYLDLPDTKLAENNCTVKILVDDGMEELVRRCLTKDGEVLLAYKRTYEGFEDAPFFVVDKRYDRIRYSERLKNGCYETMERTFRITADTLAPGIMRLQVEGEIRIPFEREERMCSAEKRSA